MRTPILAATALAAALAGAGCYATATTPDMEVVSPGVSVVTDYDYPVFYSGGVYYRYDNGGWSRSRWHNRGYVHTAAVPGAVLSVRSPGGYAHYHGHRR